MSQYCCVLYLFSSSFKRRFIKVTGAIQEECEAANKAITMKKNREKSAALRPVNKCLRRSRSSHFAARVVGGK